LAKAGIRSPKEIGNPTVRQYRTQDGEDLSPIAKCGVRNNGARESVGETPTRATGTVAVPIPQSAIRNPLALASCPAPPYIRHDV
jgi:hypothetical protein